MSSILRQALHGCFEHGDIPGACDSRHDHRREEPFMFGAGMHVLYGSSLFCLLRDLTNLPGHVCHPDTWFWSACAAHPCSPVAVPTLSCVVLIADDCSS